MNDDRWRVLDYMNLKSKFLVTKEDLSLGDLRCGARLDNPYPHGKNRDRVWTFISSATGRRQYSIAWSVMVQCPEMFQSCLKFQFMVKLMCRPARASNMIRQSM